MTDDQAELLAKLHRETRIPAPGLVQQINKGTFTADAVGHADITDILLTHDPFWSWEPLALDESGLPKITVDKSGRLAMWATLTIHGHTRTEVGTCMGTSPDPLKELVGDFLRRGAMRFGVSLALWSKSEWGKEVSTSTGGSGAGAGPSSGQRSGEENGPGPANAKRLPKATSADVNSSGGGLAKDQAIARKASELGLTDEQRQDAVERVTGYRSGKQVRAADVTLIFAELEAMAKAQARG